MLNKQKL